MFSYCLYWYTICKLIFFLFRIFSHFYVVSMFLMRRLHLTHSCSLSPDSSLYEKSFLMLFNYCVSAPYIIAGLTAVLYAFHFTLEIIRRWHRTPDTLFQWLHPVCIPYFHWCWLLAFEHCVIIARTQKHTGRQRHRANNPSELPGWYKAIEI